MKCDEPNRAKTRIESKEERKEEQRAGSGQRVASEKSCQGNQRISCTGMKRNEYEKRSLNAINSSVVTDLKFQFKRIVD
jgi:hypothetical protein